MASQRDTVIAISPPWLAGPTGSRFQYPFGIGLDGLIEKANQAIYAWMPTVGTPTALPLLGDDRVMIQGPNEPSNAFALRLRSAFDAWRHAGSRDAVFGQLVAYFQPQFVSLSLPVMGIVSTNGTTTSWDVVYSGDLTHPYHTNLNTTHWEWDGTDKFWRAWMIFYFHQVPTGQVGAAASFANVDTSFNASGAFVNITGLTDIVAANEGDYIAFSGAASPANNVQAQIVQVNGPSSVTICLPTAVVPDANNGSISWVVEHYADISPALAWGSPKKWGDKTFSWGLNVPSNTIRTLRLILSTWKSTNTWYPWMLFSFSGGDGDPPSDFNPHGTAGAGNPDNTWGTWATVVAGVNVPSRIANTGKVRVADGTGMNSPNCSVQDIT